MAGQEEKQGRGETCVQGGTCAQRWCTLFKSQSKQQFLPEWRVKTQAVRYAVVFETEEVDLRQNGFG